MYSDNDQLRGVCVVADESASWMCAGLPQLDRLLLALNVAVSAEPIQPLPVLVLQSRFNARPSLPFSRLPNLRVTMDAAQFAIDLASGPGMIAMTNARLSPDRFADFASSFCKPDGPWLRVPVGEFLDAVNSSRLTDLIDELNKLSDSHRESYIATESDLAACEDHLLRQTAKTQDGIVSRFLNRPLSRLMTRVMLRLPITPNQVTLGLMIFPLIGAWLLAGGTYWRFVLGALFFQLHSALDGCDGEIARVKYLQTPFGSKLDEICDRLSSLIYAIGLGIGLWHRFGDGAGRLYLVEAVAAALIIGVGESLLTLKPIEEAHFSDDDYSDYAQRNRTAFNRGDHLKLWVMRHARVLAAGEKFANFFSHMTKRDVFNFGFFVLALCGLPTWILHIFGVCAVMILILAVVRGWSGLSNRPDPAVARE